MENEVAANDWIGTAEAARLMPSFRVGRAGVCTKTIIRLVLSRRLEGRRRGRGWLVRRSQVVAYACGEPVEIEPAARRATTRDRKRQEEWTRGVLERVGLT